MSRHRRVACALVCALVSSPSTIGPQHAEAAGGLRISAPAAIPGAAIDLFAKGLEGKKTRVKIGGVRAKALSGNKRRVHVLVPNVPPGDQPVVVRTTHGKRRGSIEVLEPFDGTIEVVPDTLLAQSAVIGTAGGSVSATGADGTVYQLELPAGALAGDTLITLTPAAQINGLPLTGGGARAVNFTPEHLELGVPGTLRITYPTTPPANAVGFTYDSATGEAFEILGATISGNTLTLPIAHFSGGGSSGSTSQDFANAVQAELTYLQGRRLTLGQAEALAQLIFRWADLFGEEICVPNTRLTQPICGQAARVVLEALKLLFGDQCTATPPPPPTLAAIFQIIHMEALRQEVVALFPQGDPGGTPDAGDCIGAILAALLERAKPGPSTWILWTDHSQNGASSAGALAASTDGEELDALPAQKQIADLDDDDVITNAEWLEYLRFLAAQFDATTVQEQAGQAFYDAMASVVAEGDHRCAGDEGQGIQGDYEDGIDLLERGNDIASARGILGNAYFTAITECPRIKVTPSHATVEPGGGAEFTATPNWENPDIRWSVSGGTINDAGTVGSYTAPTEAGEYTVTASDLLFPGVTGTATVTVDDSPPGVGVDFGAPFSCCPFPEEGFSWELGVTAGPGGAEGVTVTFVRIDYPDDLGAEEADCATPGAISIGTLGPGQVANRQVPQTGCNIPDGEVRGLALRAEATCNGCAEPAFEAASAEVADGPD